MRAAKRKKIAEFKVWAIDTGVPDPPTEWVVADLFQSRKEARFEAYSLRRSGFFPKARECRVTVQVYEE